MFLVASFGYSVFRACVIPFSHDEAYSFLKFAQQPFAAILTDYHFPNNHILHTLLMRASFLMFGDNYLPLRLPALLGTALFLSCIWLLARRHLFSSAWIWITALIAIPMLIDYSAAARGYSLGCGLAYAGLLVLVGNIDPGPADGPGKATRCALAGVLFGLSLACVPTMLFFSVAICFTYLICELFLCERKKLIRSIFYGTLLLLCSAGTAALFYFQIETSPRSYPWGFTSIEQFLHEFWIRCFGLPSGTALLTTKLLSITTALVLIASILFSLQRAEKKMFLISSSTLLSFGVLVGTCRLFETLYPFPRSLYCVAPMILLAWIYFAKSIVGAARSGGIWLGAPLSLLLWAHYTQNANPYAHGYGPTREGGIPEALAAIQREGRSHKKVFLRVAPLIEVSVAYELQRRPRSGVELSRNSKTHFWLGTQGQFGKEWPARRIPLSEKTNLVLLKRVKRK